MSDAPSLDALARLAAECLDGSERLSLGDVERICRGLVAAVDALRAERDRSANLLMYADDAGHVAVAAERERDALAAAVREERAAEAARSRASVPLLSVADALGVFVDFAECRPTPAMMASQAAAEAHATARRATDALLSGAAPDVVRAGVVRRAAVSAFATWLRRHDALAGAWEMADEIEEEGAAVIGELIDAALAAVKETP